MSLTPIFKWAQDKQHIYLSIDLVGTKDQKVTITPTNFKWSATSEDGKKYSLEFAFSGTVDEKASKISTHRLPEFLIEKKKPEGWWPHLLTDADKKNLKGRCQVDFDKWREEDDDKENLASGLSGFQGLDDFGGGFGDEDGGADMAKLMSQLGKSAGGAGGSGKKGKKGKGKKGKGKGKDADKEEEAEEGDKEDGDEDGGDKEPDDLPALEDE